MEILLLLPGILFLSRQGKFLTYVEPDSRLGLNRHDLNRSKLNQLAQRSGNVYMQFLML